MTAASWVLLARGETPPQCLGLALAPVPRRLVRRGMVAQPRSRNRGTGATPARDVERVRRRASMRRRLCASLGLARAKPQVRSSAPSQPDTSGRIVGRRGGGRGRAAMRCHEHGRCRTRAAPHNPTRRRNRAGLPALPTAMPHRVPHFAKPSTGVEHRANKPSIPGQSGPRIALCRTSQPRTEPEPKRECRTTTAMPHACRTSPKPAMKPKAPPTTRRYPGNSHRQVVNRRASPPEPSTGVALLRGCRGDLGAAAVTRGWALSVLEGGAGVPRDALQEVAQLER